MLTLLLIVSVLFSGSVWGLEPRYGLCLACEGLARDFEARLATTAHREREEIKVGGRIGPDGEPTPKKIILYGDSEARFYDIMDHLCKDSGDHRKFCYQLTGEYEDELHEWFLHHRQTSKFINHFCYGGRFPGGCSPALLEEAREKAANEKAATKAREEAKKEQKQIQEEKMEKEKQEKVNDVNLKAEEGADMKEKSDNAQLKTETKEKEEKESLTINLEKQAFEDSIKPDPETLLVPSLFAKLGGLLQVFSGLKGWNAHHCILVAVAGLSILAIFGKVFLSRSKQLQRQSKKKD